MANLASLSTLGDGERGRAALARLLETSPVIADMDAQSAWEEDATDYEYSIDDTETTVQTRSVGGAYVPVADAPSDRDTGTQSFHGDALKIDRAHVEDDRRNLRALNGWIDRRLTKKFRSWAKGYEVLLFNGSGAGGNMKGLSKIFDGSTNLPNFNITGVIDASSILPGTPDSFDMTDPANYDAFIELMMNAIAQVENPRSIKCNKETYALINTIAREKSIRGESRDLFGRPIPTFDTVPIVKVLDNTILHTEPDNAAATVTTSIWIDSLGEQRASVVTNSGLFFKEVLDSTEEQGNYIEWEIRGQWKIEEKNAIRRIRNLKAMR